MTGWPSEPVSFSPRVRAIRSIAPPGVAGTTIFTGRDGYGCAGAALAPSASSAATAVVRNGRMRASKVQREGARLQRPAGDYAELATLLNLACNVVNSKKR